MDKSAIFPALLAAIVTVALLVGFVVGAVHYPFAFYSFLGIVFFGAVVFFFYGIFRDAR